MPFPSYYETDIDRARKRSQEMQKEMGGASQTATGSLSAYQQLQAKLAEDEDSKQRLALEQAREDRIAAFGRGGSANSGKGKGSAASTPSGLSPGQDVPDLTLGAPAPGAPMTVQEALNAKLTPGMSMLPKNAAAQVADVGDIMQKAGLNQESRTDAVPNTGDDIIDQGMGSKTPGALPSPDVRAALQRVEGSAQGDETMASPDVQKQAVDLDKEKAEAAKVAAQAKVAEKKAAPSTGGVAGPKKPPKGQVMLPDGSTGKPLSPKDLHDSIATPRKLIDSLGELVDAVPELDTGLRRSVEEGAGSIPLIGKAVEGAITSDKQLEFESKIHAALANVNNAMDRRVSEATLRLWTKQVVDSAKLGKKAYADALKGIQDDMRKRQTEYESELRQSGYAVPPGSSSPSAPAGAAQGDRVVVSNGTKTVSIPRARLTEAQADGFHEVGP